MTSAGGDSIAASPPNDQAEESESALAVLRNRSFLALWLAQAVTQIGGNMVIYGLTVIVFSATQSNAAVSLLLLTFLVPAVLFSAVAGVFVDRADRRWVLIVTQPAASHRVRRALRLRTTSSSSST